MVAHKSSVLRVPLSESLMGMIRSSSSLPPVTEDQSMRREDRSGLTVLDDGNVNGCFRRD